MVKSEVNVSQARQQLRALVEHVYRSGRAVTILRRGIPEAVLMSYEQYQEIAGKKGQPKWTLKGSIRIPRHVDIDAEIQNLRSEMREALEKRLDRYAGGLQEGEPSPRTSPAGKRSGKK